MDGRLFLGRRQPPSRRNRHSGLFQASSIVPVQPASVCSRSFRPYSRMSSLNRKTHSSCLQHSPQRNGQTGTVFPPLTEILPANQTFILIGKAGFVDNDSAIGQAIANGGDDGVKAHLHQFSAIREKEPQQQGGGGEFAGDGNPFAGQAAGRHFRPGDQQGAAASAEGAAGGEPCRSRSTAGKPAPRSAPDTGTSTRQRGGPR